MMIIVMVKSAKVVAKKTTTARGARAQEARKVEEVKLGKFRDCEPMRLPEVPPRRIWQVVGGIALALMGIFCVATMCFEFPFAYLWQSETNVWQPDLTPLTLSWIVNNVALIVFTIGCFVGSALLFMKKKVPVGVWYVLIVALAVGFISQSVGIYSNYTLMECETESCPLVVGELSTILLCDLVILMISWILLWMIYRTNLYARHPRPRRRKR